MNVLLNMKQYESPLVDILEVEVERGFSSSVDPFSSDINSPSFGDEDIIF